RPAEGHLVGVFEVAADGEAAGDARDLHAERRDQPGQVHPCGFPLDVGIGGHDDLGNALSGNPGEQLRDPQVVGPDAVDRGDGAAEHVVAALELTGLLDGLDVPGFLDDADEGRVTPVGRAVPAELGGGDV